MVGGMGVLDSSIPTVTNRANLLAYTLETRQQARQLSILDISIKAMIWFLSQGHLECRYTDEQTSGNGANNGDAKQRRFTEAGDQGV